MDTAILIMGFGYVGLAVYFVILQTSVTNRRILAAWLLAGAKAKEEKRAAWIGIETERREYVKDLQGRFGVTAQALIDRR